MKTVLVTGAEGFVGRNLCVTLARIPELAVLKYDVDRTPDELEKALAVADVIIHLAGVNRPSNVEDFKTANADFTETLCASLLACGRRPLIILSSSIQAALDNPYGISKRQAEQAVEAYAEKCAALCPRQFSQSSFDGDPSSVDVQCSPSSTPSSYAAIYRLPNVFGKWCRPNYNSAVATWCHNIANGLPIQVRDPQATVSLVYVDDVVNAFLSDFISFDVGRAPTDLYREVSPVYTHTLGRIVELLNAFQSSRIDLQVPDQADGFTKKLHATYLSYLPKEKFRYPLKMNVDSRGSFTEFIKTPERGQVSVNIAKPGITKGNHWHHTKVEKFMVVSGKGVIRFRKIESEVQRRGAEAQSETGILEYVVNGEKLEVVDIPPGYTHNIENLGDTDMVTVMWASELLDSEKPDTFYEKV